MWFLRGRPTKITCNALLRSIPGGYQTTNYRFTVEADPETTHEGKVWIAVAFPWSPHKETGSLRFLEEDLLSKVDPCDAVTVVTRDDVEVYSRLRDLKRKETIELMHVQELINWYLDDIGVMTFWATPGETYQINYNHKIASDSQLFFPTRLPVAIAAKNPEMDYRCCVVNGMTMTIPKYLCRRATDQDLTGVFEEPVDLFTFNEWGWDDDTRFNTDNWESSDDDLESSSDDE